MGKNKPITKYTAAWLARAEEDIQVMEILLKEGGLPNSICFHAQQSGEKYFKAFLAFQGKNIRKVHDLAALLTFCEEINISFDILKAEVDFLDKFYIETRYPGDYHEFTLKEAKEASEAAQKIKEFVVDKIKSEHE